MLRDRALRTTLRVLAASALALVFLGGALRPAAAAEGKIPDKLKKQMRVMEGMLNSILLDSPNFLVSGGHASHSLYLDEFGVVLPFEASLAGGGFDFSNSLQFLKNLRVETDKERTIIWHGGGDGELDTLKSEGPDGKKNVIVLNRDGEPAEHAQKSEADLYAQGKQELIDALADYGETMTALRDDQWVAIAAFLGDDEYFKEQQITRLVIKARVRDLRGNHSREDLIERFEIEEY